MRRPVDAGASQMTVTGPPAASIRLSFASAKKAMKRLSGDQNGAFASSVPARAWPARLSSGRTHSIVRPLVSAAMYASRRPSGDSLNRCEGARRLSVSFRRIVLRYRGASAATGRRIIAMPSPSADAAKSAATAQATFVRPLEPTSRAAAAGTRVSSPFFSASASSISNRASAISARRRFGSFSRQRWRSLRIPAGTVGGSRLQSGCCVRTRARTSATSSPSNARRPASISYSTQPKAQTSARLPATLPRACSGLM